MADKYTIMKGRKGGCYHCNSTNGELFVMRDIASGQLRSLCGQCAILRIDHYLIDNTRPWPCLAPPKNP